LHILSTQETLIARMKAVVKAIRQQTSIKNQLPQVQQQLQQHHHQEEDYVESPICSHILDIFRTKI
jgi:hypothetical protein